MKLRRWLVVLMALTLFAAACGDDDGGDDSSSAGAMTGGANENTGNVNLLSAAEPEEAAAYQEIFDELINSEVDYNAEVESTASFEEQFQIRAEGGTLDLAAVPQPGAIPNLVDSGSLVSLEDLGFDIDELNDTSVNRSSRSASTTASTTASRPTSTSRAWSGTRRPPSTPPGTRCPRRGTS